MCPTIYSASEVPNEPGVYIAEDSFTTLGSGTHTFRVFDDPLTFATGKIGRRRQSRLAPNRFAESLPFQSVHDAFGARVLPDNSVVERHTCFTVPHNSGFALISDSDGDEVLCVEVSIRKGTFDCVASARINLERIVFYPSRLRQDLPMFQLMPPDFTPLMIKNHKACAGGALINRANVLSHVLFLSMHSDFSF